jgi:hypothetical protein
LLTKLGSKLPVKARVLAAQVVHIPVHISSVSTQFNAPHMHS